MTEQQKLKEMTRLWCKWNRKEISGNEFALRIGKLYKKEILETWNDPLEKLILDKEK